MTESTHVDLDRPQLSAGELRLSLRPDLGGSIEGLWLGDLPVLHAPVDGSTGGPAAAAGHPLVPYANWLGYRRFRWLGHDYTTAANAGASPHSMHGVGWQRPWSVAASGPATAELAYRHEPDAHWPFAFAARQAFELRDDGVRIELSLTNTGTVPQPVGLGWHLCFPKRSRSRLHIELTDRWESDATGLPTRRVAQPGIDGDLSHLEFDHCFEGWRGAARLRDERLALRLASSVDRLVVTTPPQQPWYGIDPASHVTNALHMSEPAAHGLRSVAPGETMSVWMTLDVARA